MSTRRSARPINAVACVECGHRWEPPGGVSGQQLPNCPLCAARAERDAAVGALGNIKAHCERAAAESDVKAKDEQANGPVGHRSTGAAFLRGSAVAFHEVAMLIGRALTPPTPGVPPGKRCTNVWAACHDRHVFEASWEATWASGTLEQRGRCPYIAPGVPVGATLTCETCNGRGVTITMGCMTPKMGRCPTCKGTGEARTPLGGTTPEEKP